MIFQAISNTVLILACAGLLWLVHMLGCRIALLEKEAVDARGAMRDMKRRIEGADTEIRKRTRLGIDIGADERHANWIVAVGTFQGRDYVETFRMDSGNFGDMCGRLREMKRYGEIQAIDAPPVFRAVVEREFRNP